MIVLFDYDSLIYKASYRIVSIQDIKGWFYKGMEKEWMEKEILNLSINRLTNMGYTIFETIEDTGIEIESIEYFITNCKKSIRKEIAPTYKEKRKANKWVNLVRKYLIEMNFAATDDEYEADDIIADRAKEIGSDKCIILSMDKDLKTIEGIHFNYYRPKVTNEKGEKLSGEMVGLYYVTKQEVIYNFWLQMLTGDVTDNVKGVPGIGEVKAKKLLSDCNNESDLSNEVVKAYQDFYKKKRGVPKGWSLNDGRETEWIKHFHINHRLLRLGK